ncbi:MAG: c-type cytochrome [Rhodobacteraceae bacterium]|nr:c-type cytochrome [Paracoccaceae bacterium]
MSKLANVLTGAALLAVTAGAAQAEGFGLGREALPEEIAAWDVAVLPDGTGLPEGSGDVWTGDEVFAEACAACHGDFAEGIDSWPPLAGGLGSLQDRRPVKTVGSYWPYVSTVWDYVHRSMPFGAAQTISADDTYAIVAYILYSNGLVDDDFVLSHENFTEVVLPNAGGFIVDDRAETEYPRFSAAPCMSDCREPVEITKRAVTLNVTPEDPDGKPAGTLPPIMASAEAAEVEATETAEAEPAAAEEPAAEMAAAYDPELVAAGERVFNKCKACHKIGEGAKNGTGPHLNGVIGHTAGSIEGFRYSKAMLEAGENGLVWTDETLGAYLADPRGYIPRNKMSFAGLKKQEEIDAVIAYIATAGAM